MEPNILRVNHYLRICHTGSSWSLIHTAVFVYNFPSQSCDRLLSSNIPLHKLIRDASFRQARRLGMSTSDVNSRLYFALQAQGVYSNLSHWMFPNSPAGATTVKTEWSSPTKVQKCVLKRVKFIEIPSENLWKCTVGKFASDVRKSYSKTRWPATILPWWVHVHQLCDKHVMLRSVHKSWVPYMMHLYDHTCCQMRINSCSVSQKRSTQPSYDESSFYIYTYSARTWVLGPQP